MIIAIVFSLIIIFSCGLSIGDYILDKSSKYYPIGRSQQTCKVCGRPDKFDFHVPDNIWKSIVPLKFRHKVVCLYCFDEFANLKGTDYHAYLSELYFAGKRATFKFEIIGRLGC